MIGTARGPGRAVALAALCAILATTGLAAGADAPEMAPLWSVHFDRVLEERSATYEAVLVARREAFRAAGEWPDGPTYRFVTEENVYAGMRPRRTFADLDAVPSGRARTREILGPDRQDAMRRDAHESLRDHHGELWKYQPDLSYLAGAAAGPDPPTATPVPGEASGTSAAVPGFLSLRIDRVKPGREDDYESSVRRMIAALEKASYPVASRCWFSSYGDGTFVTIWHAATEETFREATPEEALIEALGEETAREIMEQRWDSLAQTRALAATPRPDLSEVPPGSPAWPVLLPAGSPPAHRSTGATDR